MIAATAPVTRRVRAYFAPVNRAAGQPTIFDAAQSGGFALDTPPAPWADLGACAGFARRSKTVVAALRTGAPAMVQSQARTEVDASVSLEFLSWGKLQLALASGSQQMNLLATSTGAQANGSGGTALGAIPLLTTGGGSTATALNVGATQAAGFAVGDLVAVDVDYTGQTGYVGSWVSGAWVRASSDVNGDANYVRRVTLNVARVAAVSGGLLELGQALPAGISGERDAGEPDCRICRSRRRLLFPGVVGPVLPGWGAGGSHFVSLSAASADAAVERVGRGPLWVVAAREAECVIPRLADAGWK